MPRTFRSFSCPIFHDRDRSDRLRSRGGKIGHFSHNSFALAGAQVGAAHRQPFGTRRVSKAGVRPRVSTLNYKVKTVAGGDDINATIIPSDDGMGTRSIPPLASARLPRNRR